MFGPKQIKDMDRISPEALCSLVRDWSKSAPLEAFRSLMDSNVLGTKPSDVDQRIALIDAFMRLRLEIDRHTDAQALLVTKKAILGLTPMCNTAQKTALLMHCVRRHGVADVGVCLDAGMDPLALSNEKIDVAVCGSRTRRIEFTRAAPYAAMLEAFSTKQWLALEQAHPAIAAPLSRIPLVAIAGRNGLASDSKPIDLVSLCFALDLATPAQHTKFRRERLNRVLRRLPSIPKAIRTGSQKTVQILEILEELASLYQPRPTTQDERDKCLMLSQVVMLAGDNAAQWVRAVLGSQKNEPSAASALLHDLARCGPSNLSDDADRSLVVCAIRRLVSMGFPADLAAPGSKTTPLMEAAACGHLENMAALIEMGADVDVKDAKGHTARHLARRSGMVDAVAFIDAQQSRLAIHAALPTLALPFF